MKKEVLAEKITKKKKELEELKKRIEIHGTNIQKHQQEAQELGRQIQIKMGEVKSLMELEDES